MDYNNPKVKQAGEMVQSFMSISGVLARFTTQNADSLGLTLQQMGILNIINALILSLVHCFIVFCKPSFQGHSLILTRF